MPSIVGTWKMVGATARDRNGNPLPAPYGGRGMGRVMFNAEGRMMAMSCDGRPLAVLLFGLRLQRRGRLALSCSQ